MIPRLTLAAFYSLAASGLILAAPGKAPWVVWLANSGALGALGVAGWLVLRVRRKYRIGHSTMARGLTLPSRRPTDAVSDGRLLPALDWFARLPVIAGPGTVRWRRKRCWEK